LRSAGESLNSFEDARHSRHVVNQREGSMMRKVSKEAEEQKWAAIEKMVDAREAIGMEVMLKVFARLPLGQKFTLFDGGVARLENLS
jgi:hypothetical protein